MDKLEPRLQARLEERSTRAADYGFTAGDVASHEIEVTISHVERLIAPFVDLPESPRRQQTTMAAEVKELSSRVDTAMKPIVAQLKKLGVEKPRVLHLANAVTAKLTPAQMQEIAAMDEVELIRWEAIDDVALMQDSVRVVEAFETWREFNVRGTGVKVAVMDSGVDRTHPALAPNVVDEFDATGGGLLPAGSHGTHVAGTIASRDPVYMGVAPEAQLVNIKVLTAAGGGQPQWVIQGFEEAVRRGVRVANLSLGWSEPGHGWVCNDGDCILCRAADNASRLGVCVVVAAGNEGSAGPGLKIRHPGAAREVITVAAVDKGKVLAPFSSVGPGSARLSPGSAIRITKPDIAAPGVAIRSTIPGGGFANFNGTSMASPHVAGVAALAIQQHPEARPTTIKKLLEHTSEALPYGPLEVGYGMVNAYSVVAHR